MLPHQQVAMNKLLIVLAFACWVDSKTCTVAITNQMVNLLHIVTVACLTLKL